MSEVGRGRIRKLITRSLRAHRKHRRNNYKANRGCNGERRMRGRMCFTIFLPLR